MVQTRRDVRTYRVGAVVMVEGERGIITSNTEVVDPENMHTINPWLA
jgi:hypothetical protein